jgi:hypothetical protein
MARFSNYPITKLPDYQIFIGVYEIKPLRSAFSTASDFECT